MLTFLVEPYESRGSVQTRATPVRVAAAAATDLVAAAQRIKTGLGCP